jgi:hypothetical protein
VGPDQAAPLPDRVGARAQALLELVLGRLVRHVDALPVDVELPAVVDAAQAALLVAAEEQAGTAVRAELVEPAEAALAVAEGDQPLAEQADTHRRRAIGRSLRSAG